MRGAMQSIHRRVERLMRTVQADSCDGHHRRPKLSVLQSDEPEPPWPAPDSPTHCPCGARLDYRHTVIRLYPGPPPT
jgi:hypothetical protein